MGSAPQPPHERTWRHPSELAPSVADVESSTGGGRGLVLATGLTAAMLAAVLVVAVTPPRSNAPTAISATTLPALTVQLRGASGQDASRGAVARDSDVVRYDTNSMSRDESLALVGAPHSVSAVRADLDSLDVGDQVPAGGDRVHVLTESHIYVVRWSQIRRIVAPEGAVVTTADGALLAVFDASGVRILVD